MSSVDSAGPLDVAERLELIRSLAAAAGVVGRCLTPEYAWRPFPEDLASLGIVELHDDLEVGDFTRRLAENDGAALMAAFAGARRRGAAEASIVIPSEPESGLTRIVIVDLTASHDVTVLLQGGTGPGIGTEDATAETPTRRVVQHRNEIAELLWIDPKGAALLGFEVDTMLGRSAVEFIHPDDRERGVQAWLGLRAGEPAIRHRVRWMTHTGEWRWFEITHTDRLATDGYVESEMLDVDDEMRALAKVREGELRFQTLTESLPMGVIHVSDGGDSVYVNPWLADLMVFDPDAAPGERFPTVHPEDRAPLSAAFDAAMTTSTETDLDVRVHSRADDDEHTCRVRVRPIDAEQVGEQPSVIASVEDITDAVRLEAQLRHRARTDPLTGLHNRPALSKQLQRDIENHAARRTTDGLAVLFIDLDGFKLVNDGHGHHVGDALLVELADRISRTLRSRDIAARVGGDEFVVVLNDCPGLGEATIAAERLIAACEAPVDGASVSCSVGIAIWAGEGDTDAEGLLTEADLAMYAAKRAGGGQWAPFDESLHGQMATTFELQRGVLETDTRDEFSLHLQPLRHLGSGDTWGVECLARWFHPSHGLISGARFIPLAEQSGLIVPLGRFVLDEACRIAARARADGRPDLRVSLNISTRQLAHSDYEREFFEALERHDVPASQMILEVTEAVFVGTDGDAVETLRSLGERGATIALDDFGTGLSSLNQLRLAPASMIKVDGSYVGDLETDSGTRAVTHALVDVSRELGLELVAEEIETVSQLHLLRSIGIELGQGHLLGRPLAEDAFFTALQERTLPQLLP